MQGKVLDYDASSKSGKIAGHDGQRYSFQIESWKDSSKPQAGDEVDFVPLEQFAKDIFILEGSINRAPQTSALAITSLIFGLVGLFSSWFFLGIPSLIAIVFGHIAKFKVKHSKGALNGGELATVGLILGYIVLVLALLTIVGFVGFMSAIAEAGR